MAGERSFSRKLPPYALAWLLLRLYTSLSAVVFSSLRPITQIEKTIALWPPAADVGLWLNRLFLAPWLRWDALWYNGILTGGYIAGNGSTSFHPLYVILSFPLYGLGLDPLFSLMITSSLAALGFFWIFRQLAGLDLPPEKSSLALMLLATFPLALILFAPYPESVFLFFATLALYEMRRRRWLLAALATCLASLTRQQGVLLGLPMLWYAWEDSGKTLHALLKGWRGWLATITAPLGLFIWAFVRIMYLHEGVLDTRNWKTFFYSALLSTSAKAIVPDQALVWPWNALAAALPRLLHAPDIEDVMSVGLGAVFLALLALAWKYMQPAGRLYSLAIALVSFSLFTGSGRIYLGLPRHLFLAVPVFVGLAAALRKRWEQITLLALQLLVQIFMLFLYVTKAWIP